MSAVAQQLRETVTLLRSYRGPWLGDGVHHALNGYELADHLESTDNIDSRILEAALGAVTNALNDLVGECLGPNGPKAPTQQALMRARAMLPKRCPHAFPEKSAQK